MRVLVVEDEHLIANSIRKGLEQEKFAVDVCYDGTSGYDLAATEDYDLIILDLMLPGIDGMIICKRLRDKKIHTPIIILTARGQIEDKVKGLNYGADDYLTKPFSFEELLARIRAILRRPKEKLSDVLVANDISLDTKLFEVKKAGKNIYLSSREFTLLEFFMRSAGKILTKEQIMSHVWDYDSDILPNTVEVYIKNLRAKIGSSVIKTMRGFGYKLNV